MGFRTIKLAEFSYGSVMKVIPEVCKIHEKMIKSCMKVSSSTESERPDKFLHESFVRTVRKLCQVLITKALSSIDYESPVKG